MNKPKTYEPRDIFLVISASHHTPQDLDEGDISDRIWQFGQYEDRMMDISSFDLNEFDLDEDLVEAYAARIDGGEIPPPIIYDTINKSTIDGLHRLNALAKCGITEIAVRAGVESTYTPIDDPEDDDLHDTQSTVGI